MSGFFGMLRDDGEPVDASVLSQISEELRFRGPHGANVWTEKGLGGCFTLLRTGPAPQAEQQPAAANDRLRLWGDIRLDARDNLRAELGGVGCETSADATSEELFLRAWQTWGASALERVIGDFSLALWDGHEQTLWCARDFVGARPFYYARIGRSFYFGNTLDILRPVPDISQEFDEAYIGDFLLEGWNAEPSRTVYRDIRRLPAGHVLRYTDGEVSVRRFRKLPVEEPLRLRNREEYVEGYLELLRTAINDRLPRGATALYLSGGMDSSAVCAITTQLATQRCQRDSLQAFTASWRPVLDDREPDFAKLTATHLGLAHHIFEEPNIVPFESPAPGESATPEPSLDVFLARDQRYYRCVAEHSNVVLSGDGGDDVLLGQAWPYLVYLWKGGDLKHLLGDFGAYFLRHGRLPPLRGGFRGRIRRMLRQQTEPDEQYPEWLNSDFENRMHLHDRWRELRRLQDCPDAQERHPVHPRAYGRLHSGYWAGVLETEDAGWTRVNLETRAPLLDLRLIRYLLRLPPVPWCANKELCRVAMSNLLPKSVVTRPKTPLPGDVATMIQAEDWQAYLPRHVPQVFQGFITLQKWCETFSRPEGFLTWSDLRPLSLLKWLESH